jgi:cytochrome c oxidase subunit IV
MNGHIISRKTYLLVWIGLMIMLAATLIAAAFDLGWLNLVIALVIAVCKALLIAIFFMHLRVSSRATWVFAGAGLFWLGILLALAMSDYLSRGWLPSAVP